MIELFRWENIIFLAPLVTGVVFFLISQITGLGGHSDGDLHADVHADVHAHIGGGVNVGEHDYEHSSDVHHSDTSSGSDRSVAANPLVTLLGFFGVGKAPLTVIILSWVIIWGVSGYACNILLGYPLITISLILASVFSIFGTSLLARGIARVIPNTETYVQSGLQYWGTEGTVINTLTRDSGSVRIRDRYGNILDLRCWLLPEQGEAILPGTKVVIDVYDQTTGIYTVLVVSDHGLEAQN